MYAPKGTMQFSASGKWCFIYPMEDRSVVMLALTTSIKDLAKRESQKDLHRIFSDFKPYVGHLIDAIEDPEHLFKDNLAYVEMEDWYKGRVVLTGDAQHAVSPITGMGASMALEDAYVLSEELKDVSAENIPKALENYSKRRGKRIKRFREASAMTESWIMVKSPILSILRDVIIKFIPISYFTRPIEKLLEEKI